MRVLAVIPARAGSERIPNKNMRLIADRPMVTYSIQNALDSKLITDVLVSTDSLDVMTVAQQMGVPYRNRPANLCGPEVTIGPVVWDAVHSLRDEFDYVVTLQPTSPCLKAETIDLGIRHAIATDADTVISVARQSSLAWVAGDEGYVPEYVTRKNSQYLPPRYEETGAFFISKRTELTPTSRVAGRTEVYEISEDEAISVQTFQDLALARVVLTDASVTFFVNGNNQIGTGHVYRVLELADEFYARATIIYDRNLTNPALFQNCGHTLVGVDGTEGLFDHLREHSCRTFVNDVLSTSMEYMQALRDVLPDTRIVNFEDEGDGARYADLVFNALLGSSAHRNVRFGADYYIAPKTLLLYRPISVVERVRNVLVTFGGADPMDYTDRVLRFVCENRNQYANVIFRFILGPAKRPIPHLDTLELPDNVQILQSVHNMPELMSKSDIALASRGRTCYELAALGVPTISIAENEREETHGFISQEHGFHYLGRDPSTRMIKAALDLYIAMDSLERKQIQGKLLSSNLRHGRHRVVGLISSL